MREKTKGSQESLDKVGSASGRATPASRQEMGSAQRYTMGMMRIRTPGRNRMDFSIEKPPAQPPPGPFQRTISFLRRGSRSKRHEEELGSQVPLSSVITENNY